MDVNRILITGAAGNLGKKLTAHLAESFELVRVDVEPDGPDCTASDITEWNESWTNLFDGVDVVVHLAADPTAAQVWSKVIAPNIDGMINVFSAAVSAGVKRVVFASSNHVMGGYKDQAAPGSLTADTSPMPGTRYESAGEQRDSTPYASTKLMGERLGACYSKIHGISVVAVRIGWIKPAANLAADIPPERGAWFRDMWISNDDFCDLMTRCVTADIGRKFVIVNGMSNNPGMPWSLDEGRKWVEYDPVDSVAKSPSNH